MDDLVAALYLLARKLRVDVGELSDRYVLYTQITAIVLFVVYLICSYVAYKVITYCANQYNEADPLMAMEKRVKKIKGEIEREVALETAKIARNSVNAGVRIAKVVLIAVVVGIFLIHAAVEIPTIVMPRGAALDAVLSTMKDATKVEIVKEKTSSSSRKQESERDQYRDQEDPINVQSTAPHSGEPMSGAGQER